MKKLLIALGLVALPMFGIGCEAQEESDTFGDQVEETGEEVGEEVEEFGEDTEDAVEEVN